jgi:citrate lyase subunit alpha/citrate CoA-transferase
MLSALEIDVNYNVNVMTGSNGVLRGASGGHSDTAAGADLTIITAPLVRGRIPCVVEKVLTTVTRRQRRCARDRSRYRSEPGTSGSD